jgi:hypothetical protein
VGAKLMRHSLKSSAKLGGANFPAYMAGCYETIRDKAMIQARATANPLVKQLYVSHARWANRKFIEKLMELRAPTVSSYCSPADSIDVPR